MNIRFDGRTVAVTGAGHGFGRCIAQTFAHLGARVFATDISADELAETAAHGGPHQGGGSARSCRRGRLDPPGRDAERRPITCW